MTHRSHHPLTILPLVLVLLAAMLACNLASGVTPPAPTVQPLSPTGAVVDTIAPPPVVADTATTEPTATSTPIVHTLHPGSFPEASESNITDRDSSAYAAQHRSNGGDNFFVNLFERPFNAKAMNTYFPDLDITKTSLVRDSTWVYVYIKLVGQNQAGGLLQDYGVEVDLNVDGRGDVLVMASRPGKKWSTDRVGVWLDKNNDVGSSHPVDSDAPASTDGYETQIFKSGVGTDPDLAWARLSPNDENTVQIAFKRSVINDDNKFAWGAWALSQAMFNPAWFDFDDHFTQAEAGSPLIEQTKYYPLGSLAEVDNTCRWAVGFTPTGSEPGICAVPATPTPIPPATIWGSVWIETEYVNGIFNAMHDKFYFGASVRVRTGSCGSPGSTVATAAVNELNYSVTVAPGTYCVDVPTMAPGTDRSSGAVGVTLNAGDSARVKIYFWNHSIH